MGWENGRESEGKVKENVGIFVGFKYESESESEVARDFGELVSNTSGEEEREKEERERDIR